MVSTPSEQPLVTFFVVAFNQERYVREAVEGAFAQTYSPLEIVLSDDCSSDHSFEIMEGMAKAYRGPHQVVLNRNPVRKSIGGHLNRVLELARGELLVGSAGDDISLPERTRHTYEAWERSGRQATSIYTDFVQIGEDGQVIERVYQTESQVGPGEIEVQAAQPLGYVQTLKPIVFGCTHAFSRQLLRRFGRLRDEIIHEDNALAFRSVLAGQLLYINRPLVKYRVHGENIYLRARAQASDLKTLTRQEERLRRDFRNRETMYGAFLEDLEIARAQGLIGAEEAGRVAQEAGRRRDRASMMGKFLDSGPAAKCRIFCQLRREGMTENERATLVRRLVPQALLLRLRQARSFFP
jgi:cellulose synthase/poly-beta-1,6-N-acetylglucosamine synthase-like glycosyltransferase